MDVKAYMEEKGLQRKDVIAAIRVKFPKYNTVAHSFVTRPEETGVRLVDEAEAILEAVPASGQKPARARDRHKVKARISARVSKAFLGRFNTAFRASRYKTVQEAVIDILRMWVELQELQMEMEGKR